MVQTDSQTDRGTDRHRSREHNKQALLMVSDNKSDLQTHSRYIYIGVNPGKNMGVSPFPVSYTHLTLPTILRV